MRHPDLKDKSGTTDKCLLHLATSLPKGPGTLSTKEQFAQFARVNLNTISRWLTGKHLPVGEHLISVRFYLEEVAGYNVTELSQMPKPIYRVARLVARHQLSVDQLMKELSLTNRGHMLGILEGRHRSSEENEHRMSLIAQRLEASTGDQSVASHGEEARNLPDRTAVISALAQLVRAVVPLAELAVSDTFSAADRQELRRLANGDGVFRASNLLNRLCGEKARELIPARVMPSTKE